MDPDKGTLILLEILSLLADYLYWNDVLYNSTFTSETHEKVLFFPFFSLFLSLSFDTNVCRH